MSNYTGGLGQKEGWSFGLGATFRLSGNTGRSPNLFGFAEGGVTLSAFTHYHGGTGRTISPSFGLRYNYYQNFYGTNVNGSEFIASAKVNLNFNGMGRSTATDANNSRLSLGTNIFYGLGAMSEFRQQTGLLEFEHNSLRIRYENDGGIPFKFMSLLADRDDKYRTAAVEACSGPRCLYLNLFTGRRDQSSYAQEEVDRYDPNMGEKRPYHHFKTQGRLFANKYGLVYEQPHVGYGLFHPKHYRHATLMFSRDNGYTRWGLDSQWLLGFQDGIHWLTSQPYFNQYSDKFGFQFQRHTNNVDPFTSW